MTRSELLDWMQIEGEQLDRLLERGLPTQPGGQYSPTEVAAWLEEHGLADKQPTAPALPPNVVRTKREAAAALGRTRPTLDDWLGAGCPGREGYYDLDAMRAWRDKRDRELKRPATYGSNPRAVSDADLAELRGIIEREIDHESSTHFFAVSDAIDAVLALGATLPADEDERRKLLIPAICPAFKPWIPGQNELPAKIKARMDQVLDCLPK
jgi:hypothetical protein